MPMTQFVPETLILSGEVNDNFQNAVSVDTPRNITVSHNWTARQNLEGGIRVGAGDAAQPSIAFALGGALGAVGFYYKGDDLIGVVGRLDLPGFGVVAGNGIRVSGGSTTPFNVSARRSADGGNALAFGSDGGLYVSPGQMSISTDVGNELEFGSDGGLFAPSTLYVNPLPPRGDYNLTSDDVGKMVVRTGAQETGMEIVLTPDVFPDNTHFVLVDRASGLPGARMGVTRGPGVALRMLVSGESGSFASWENSDVLLAMRTVAWLYHVGNNQWYIWLVNGGSPGTLTP